MSQTTETSAAPVTVQTSPDRYHHWKLDIDGDLARLTLDHRLSERHPMRLADESWESEALDHLLTSEQVPLSAAVVLAGC